MSEHDMQARAIAAEHRAEEAGRALTEARSWRSADDQPLPEDDAIEAAFPTRSGRHDLYSEAMRLVGARRSKGGLVALVTWLLLRVDVAETRAGREAAKANQYVADWMAAKYEFGTAMAKMRTERDAAFATVERLQEALATALPILSRLAAPGALPYDEGVTLGGVVVTLRAAVMATPTAAEEPSR